MKVGKSIRQIWVNISGRNSQSSDVLHQLTAGGERVKSLLTWKHVGFSPLAASYRPSDGLLVLGGGSNRIKTFKLRPLGFKRTNVINIPAVALDRDSIDTTDGESDIS